MWLQDIPAANSQESLLKISREILEEQGTLARNNSFNFLNGLSGDEDVLPDQCIVTAATFLNSRDNLFL